MRVPQSGPVGQGSCGALHHPRCHRAGRVKARRHDCRGHGGQYRHRVGAGRRVDGVPHGDRHSRNPKPGKERHDPAGGGGTGAGAGGTLPESEQLCALFRPPGRGAGADRTQWGGLGQSVRQCGQPPGPFRDHRPRDLGPDRGPRRWLHLLGRVGRHLGGRRHGVAAARREDRSGRPRGGGAACVLHHGQAGRAGIVDHRRHRAGPDHRQSGRLHPRFQLSHFRCRGAAAGVRDAGG